MMWKSLYFEYIVGQKDYLFFNNYFLWQELNLPQAVVNRLQTVGLRFCGPADQALARLRGALPTGIFFMADVNTCTSNERW